MACIPGIDVILLAYNEENSLEQAVRDVHEALAPLSLDYSIVIVDDGSTDSTLTIANRLSAHDPLIRVKGHIRNKGMGASTRTGFSAGTLPYATMLPADRQIRADVLPALIELAGPRTIVTSLYTNRPNDAIRTLVSRSFRLFLHLALGPTPELEGTYIVPRDLLDTIDLTSDTFTVAFEMFHRAKKRGYAFETAHIESHAREEGTSKVFNPRRIAQVFKEVVKLRWTLRHIE
ncbi:MAG: glycosyltransferase family 2 protein [Deltaproteobacteria bacterium]|nr:glycosyltransferase family 2 protein [Deltaproteobacteria bacterium]